ncbi:MAG: ABC transporter ATP-binding protein [Thermodesulfobacteriota bacterium]|nr:ABC transporter ATP-binding protein [Thermodesulfobacteriota bacterium]
MKTNPLQVKLKNALRIDRAVWFVWQAGPGWAVISAVLIVFQGALPLLSLYLVKLIIDAVAALISSSSAVAETGSVSVLHVFHHLSRILSDNSLYRAAGLEEGFPLVIVYIALAGGAGLLTALSNFFSEYVKKAQALAVTDHMFSVLHEKSVSLDLAFYESPEYRDTLHRAQKEGPYRPTSIVNGLVLTGRSAASFAAVMGLLVMFQPILPLVVCASAVPGVFMRLKYSDRIYSWQKKRTEDERKAHYFNWMLTGEAHAGEFRLFGLGEHFIDRFSTIRESLRSEKLWFEKRRAAGDFIAQASAVISVFGCFVYIAFETVQGHITIGDMVMYFQAFQKGLASLNSLLSGVAALYEDNLFLSNFYEFLDVKSDIKDPDDPVCIHPAETFENSDKSSDFGGETGFKAEDLSFKYKNSNTNIINNVNFSIKPGEVVALVGENGSGKSTLVKLLCRLYDPVSGSIALNGVDIRNHSIKAYQKLISVVFQDYIRYYLTARENIWLGDIDAEENSPGIEKAAEKAGIKSQIEQFHSGFNTPLGRWFKHGEALSTGQWQMVALARAFFRDAALVILDEPASSLDVNTEFELFKKFKDLVKGKSALIISHRFSTVKMADRILLLHNGSILENGSHESLMAKNGRYAALYRKQAGQYVGTGLQA